MSILPLVNLAISRVPANSPQAGSNSRANETLVAWLAGAAAASLQEAETLRSIENDIRNQGKQEFDRAAAEILRGAYEAWAAQADAILKRCARMRQRDAAVPGTGILEDRHGRIMAMLQVSLDDIDEADAQLRRGEGRTLEEVRNELRAIA